MFPRDFKILHKDELVIYYNKGKHCMGGDLVVSQRRITWNLGSEFKWFEMGLPVKVSGSMGTIYEKTVYGWCT